MRYLTVDEFKTRELHNGEKYILIFDIGQPITVRERQNIINQVKAETDRFQINDEWTDSQNRYYMQIEIINNLIWGLAIILVLSAGALYVAGKALSETLSQIAVVEKSAIPLAALGLAGIVAVLGYKWLRSKKT